MIVISGIFVELIRGPVTRMLFWVCANECRTFNFLVEGSGAGGGGGEGRGSRIKIMKIMTSVHLHHANPGQLYGFLKTQHDGGVNSRGGGGGMRGAWNLKKRGPAVYVKLEKRGREVKFPKKSRKKLHKILQSNKSKEAGTSKKGAETG